MATDFAAYVTKGHEKFTEVEQWLPGPDSNEPFVYGDFVFYDTSDDQIKRCGADPTLIAGISEIDSEKAKLITPDGRVPVRVIKASGAVLIMASATTPVKATHVGIAYGIARNAAAHWVVDVADTTNTRVRVLDVDVDKGLWYVQVLTANLQFSGI